MSDDTPPLNGKPRTSTLSSTKPTPISPSLISGGTGWVSVELNGDKLSPEFLVDPSSDQLSSVRPCVIGGQQVVVARHLDHLFVM